MILDSGLLFWATLYMHNVRCRTTETAKTVTLVNERVCDEREANAECNETRRICGHIFVIV